jgi:hypothetical protein
MAQVKGKFIKLVGNLMLEKEKVLANEFLQEKLNLSHRELVDEGWYDTLIFDRFMSICVENSVSKDNIYLFIGKKVYPTIKKTVGLPEYLSTPLDFIKFEAEGFLMNHQGDDVIPRKFIQVEDKEVIVQAIAPNYNSKLYEGVFLGILEMCAVQTGKVENLGDDTFKITW